jgi:hypothetical protein
MSSPSTGGAWPMPFLEIDDSYTLIPEDQPHELARAIREFARATEPTEQTA